MIEQLIALISSFWRQIIPFYVVDEFDKGIKLRLGRFKSVVEPGLRFKLPFMDEVLIESVVTNTYNLPSQALTTKDNKEIVVAAVVKYNISDIKKFMLNITDTESAIQDICLGKVRSALTSKNWVECQEDTVDNYISSKVRSEVKQYGISIEKVSLTDMTRVRSYRLFME